MPQRQKYTDARPLISYAYLLESYKSKGRLSKGTRPMRGRKGNQYSLLARLVRKTDQFRFLCTRTDEVYLFDLEFVHALEQAEIGRVVQHRYGYGHALPTFQLCRRDIRLYREPSLETLQANGIRPEAWVFRKIEMETHFRVGEVSLWMKFPLYTALSPELDAKVIPVVELQNDAGLPF